MVKMQAHICIGTKHVISIEHVYIFQFLMAGLVVVSGF